MTSDASSWDARARALRALLRDRGLEPGAETVGRTSREGRLLASLTQRRMWMLHAVAGPRSYVHNVPMTARLRGALDHVALQRALNAVVARHESLRTCFALSGPEVIQHVSAQLEVPIVQHDLTDAPDPWSAVRSIGLEDARRTFDLARLPLLRATLLRLAAKDHVLLVTAQHIVWDGTSTGLLVHELATSYRRTTGDAAAVLPALPIQYADWAAWEREHLTGATLDRHADYWRGRLAGARSVRLPSHKPPSADRASSDGATLTFTISPDLTRKLAQLASEERATLFMVLLAAFTALVHRLAEADDVTIATLMANRTRPEAEALIGYFVNMVPIRSTVDRATTFTEHLAQIRRTAIDAYAHQELPRGRILKYGAEARAHGFDDPLYTIHFQVQNAPRPRTDFGGIRTEIVDRNSATSDLDLGLILWQRHADFTEDEGMQGWCEYATELFDESMIRGLLERYTAALEAVAGAPAMLLADLPVAAGDWPGVRVTAQGSAPVDPSGLADITAALLADAAVLDAVVTVSDEDAATVAYVVPAQSPPAHLEDVRIARWREVYDSAEHPDTAHPPDVWAEATADRVRALDPDRVLEIGCGSGALLRRLGGACAEYRASDLAPMAIDRLRATLAEDPYTGVTLRAAEAETELDDVPSRHYDVVVMDRVVECFPSTDYLERVLRRAVERVRYGGYVFLGGVRSLALLRAGHARAELALAAPHVRISALRSRVERAVRREENLVVDPAALEELAGAIPRVASVQLLPRIDRYDVIVHLDVPVGSAAPRLRHYWTDRQDLGRVEQLIVDKRPSSLAVIGVTDAWWASALAADIVLDEPIPGAVAADLRRAIADSGGAAPAELAALARRHGYTVFPSLDGRRPGHFDALFCRDAAHERPVALARTVPVPARSPCASAANSPTVVDIRERLSAGLRTRLPRRRMPATFVVLDALPMLRDGVVNRFALPAVACRAPGVHCPVIRPRDEAECAVAETWSDVLEGVDFGVEDRLGVDIPCHPIVAARLAARLRERLGVGLTLGQLLERPTVAGVARCVAIPDALER